MRFCLSITFAFILCWVFVSKPLEGIRCGNPAISHLNKWMAAIYRLSLAGEIFTCGGVLIQRRYVLTAGHCIERNVNYVVYLGIDDMQEAIPGPCRFEIQSATVHPSFKVRASSYDYDVAIILLHKDAVGENIYPVTLASHFLSQETLVCDISGWGYIDDVDQRQPLWLRTAGIPLADRITCNNTGHYAGEITESMLCAGVDDICTDACKLDSGGPLICYINGNTGDAYLHGIVSFGFKAEQPLAHCSPRYSFGVYANISMLHDWIVANTPPPTHSDDGPVWISARGMLDGMSLLVNICMAMLRAFM